MILNVMVGLASIALVFYGFRYLDTAEIMIAVIIVWCIFFLILYAWFLLQVRISFSSVGSFIFCVWFGFLSPVSLSSFSLACVDYTHKLSDVLMSISLIITFLMLFIGATVMVSLFLGSGLLLAYAGTSSGNEILKDFTNTSNETTTFDSLASVCNWFLPLHITLFLYLAGKELT